jgi:hypothetical protein
MGWDVIVLRQGMDAKVATWTAKFGGLEWLDQLVKEHRAVALGGAGFPLRYSVAAAVLLPIISKGIPGSPGPAVICDDNMMPTDPSGLVKLDKDNLAACSPDEQLMVDAWDQS